MRKLERIVFTGVDRYTDIDKLCKIQEKYPKVEFGVLLSKNYIENGPRFMGPQEIEVLEGLGLNLAAHLCGSLASEAIRGNLTESLGDYLEHFGIFQRIQINNPLAPIVWNPEDLKETLLISNVKEVILQRRYPEDIPGIQDSRLSILMDLSGGRGKWSIPEPTGWSGKVGYAGGIGPENILEAIDYVVKIPEEGETWIDMETLVRTYERFDLEKVEKVLEIAYGRVS